MSTAEPAATPQPVRVGLVGAGPWANILHAPLWSAGPETVLAGVWARRPDAAAPLAAGHGTEPVTDFDALLERSDAIAFSVPPSVQWGMAIDAAKAGKHLVLEKPLAENLDDARELADAVSDASVGSMVMFTTRFHPHVRTFIEQSRSFDAAGARVAMLTPAFLRGPFADSPWRRERGALLDVGPHVLDLITEVLGPVTQISARATARGWIGLHLDHESGAASDVTISCHIGTERGQFSVDLYGPDGTRSLDVSAGDQQDLYATLRRELVEVVHGIDHPCDVRRGLYVQELVDAAERSLVA